VGVLGNSAGIKRAGAVSPRPTTSSCLLLPLCATYLLTPTRRLVTPASNAFDNMLGEPVIKRAEVASSSKLSVLTLRRGEYWHGGGHQHRQHKCGSSAEPRSTPRCALEANLAPLRTKKRAGVCKRRRLRPQKKMMPQDGAMLYLYGNSPRLEIHKRMVRIFYKASERGLQHFIRCMLVKPAC
jgi:hypothetical protein